jgi:hypothetical protein
MKRAVYIISVFLLFVHTNMVFGQISLVQEKIYVQTDRDIYIAGENLFFKLSGINTQTGKPMIASKFAYLVLRNENNTIIEGICLKLENSIAFGCIFLPDTLSTGKYQLISYTNCMRNFGGEAFFVKEIFVANRFDRDLLNLQGETGKIDTLFSGISLSSLQNSEKEIFTVTPDKKNYAKREKIKLRLNATGIREDEIANLSISVHEKVPQYAEDSWINNYSRNSEKRFRKDSIQDCFYLPEINGIVLQGNVKLTENNMPVPTALVFLSSPDTIVNLQIARSDEAGTFHFQLNDYYTGKNLIITLPDTHEAKIELDNKYDLKIPFKSNHEFGSASLIDYLHKCQNIVQIQKIYKIETRQDLKPDALNISKPLVYPPTNNIVYPREFLSLPNFEEISRELLPLLKTRKHGEWYEANLFDMTNSLRFDAEPQIFLDGVPINNINQIMYLGSDQIDKIETVATERYFGDLYFSGIMAVFTLKSEINNIVWQSPKIKAECPSIQPYSIYTIPKISETNRNPDFRQLLYWDPDIFLSVNEEKYIEFTASDNMGDFVIKVEGITSKGTRFSTNTLIHIGFN